MYQKLSELKRLIIYSVSQLLSLIDGVVDLIDNFNGIESSKQIVNELLRLCSTHNLAYAEMQAKKELEREAKKVEKESERKEVMYAIILEHGGSISRKNLVEEVMNRTGMTKAPVYKTVTSFVNSGILCNSDGTIYISNS